MGVYLAQAVAALMFALGMGAITYPGAASARGWVSGGWVSNFGGYYLTVAFSSIFVSLFFAFFRVGWIGLFVTPIAGYILMTVLLSLLRSTFRFIPLSLFAIMPWSIWVLMSP